MSTHGKRNRRESVKHSGGRNTSGLKRGGSPGRPKGVPNKATTEAKEACARIVDDPVYREKLLSRALKGTLAPPVEVMLWHYAKGKPKETIEHQGQIGVLTPEAVAKLSDAELAPQALALAKRAKEIAAQFGVRA